MVLPAPVTGSARSDFTYPSPISNSNELSRYYIRALRGVKGKILAMKCLRLTHVNVRVEKLDDAIRFYTEVLGLEPIPRGDRKGKGAWFRLGTTEHPLAHASPSAPRPERRSAAAAAHPPPAGRGP